MAEEEEKPAEQPEPAKKSSKLPLIASGVLVLAGVVVALWYLRIGPFAGAAARHAEATAAIEEHAEDDKGKPAAILALEPFIANLADDGGRRYLKATFQIDFGTAIPPTMQARLPQVRDLLLTLFTSKTFDDIRTPEGKQQLREEIIARINQVLDRDAVKAVYFTEFIVQ